MLGGRNSNKVLSVILFSDDDFLVVDDDDYGDDDDDDDYGDVDDDDDNVEIVFQIIWKTLLQVELMSAEKFDPTTGKWEMVKEMHRKR